MRTFVARLGVTAGVGLLGVGMFLCASTWPNGLGYAALGAWGSALARLSYEEARR